MNSGINHFPSIEFDTGNRIGNSPDRIAGVLDTKLYHHLGEDNVGLIESRSGGGNSCAKNIARTPRWFEDCRF